MKYFVKYLFFFFIMSSVTAQQNEVPTKKYDAIVSFNSMCCGTPSSEFLKSFLNKYNNKHMVGLQAWQLGSCGREGEFKIFVSLSTLKTSKKEKFKNALKNLIPIQNNKNKALKPSSGNINLEFNLPISNFNNCAGQLTNWNF